MRRRTAALVVGSVALVAGVIPVSANAALPRPVISSVVSTGADTDVAFTMSGVTAGQTVYFATVSDPTDCTKGSELEGQDPFVADASGNISGTLKQSTKPAGTSIGVSAYTVSPRDSSPLSACATVPDGPHVAFAASNYTVNENAGSVAVTVVRTGGLDAEVDFHVEATRSAGKQNPAPFADPGTDYPSQADVAVTIPSGASSAVVQFPLLDDKVVDGPKVLVLGMLGIASGAQAQPATTEVLINDDDVAPPPPAPTGPSTTTTGHTALATVTALKPVRAHKRVAIGGSTGGAAQVKVAIVQFNPRKQVCRYVKASGLLGIAPKVKTLAACRAKGLVAAKVNAKAKTFTRTLPRGLPKGSYTVASSAQQADGTGQTSFTSRNQRTLLVI